MISVISPSYNQRQFLPFCLQSIADQRSDASIEHIVLDGGSTDGSIELLENASPPLDGWSSGPDGGQSHAINTGMARAKGSILCWINSDDGLALGACERMQSALGAVTSPAWAIGGCRVIGEDGSPSGHWRPVSGVHDQLSGIVQWGCNYLMQPAVFWNREMWEVAGPLVADLHYCMDFDLWLRFFKMAPPILVSGDIGIHRQQKDSKTSLVGAEIFSEYRSAIHQRLDYDKCLKTAALRDVARQAAKAGNAAMFHNNSGLSRRCLAEAMKCSPTALLEPHFLKAVARQLSAALSSSDSPRKV